MAIERADRISRARRSSPGATRIAMPQSTPPMEAGLGITVTATPADLSALSAEIASCVEGKPYTT